MDTERRELKWYLSQVYKTIIEPIPEEEGGGFEAYMPTLGRSTCVAVGDTEEEALRSVKQVKEILLESWLNEGLPIPLPENEDTFSQEYSGKILLRTTKEMHQHLVLSAERQGVSLNSYVNQCISLGHSLALFQERVDKLVPQLSISPWPSMKISEMKIEMQLVFGTAEESGLFGWRMEGEPQPLVMAA